MSKYALCNRRDDMFGTLLGNRLDDESFGGIGGARSNGLYGKPNSALNELGFGTSYRMTRCKIEKAAGLALCSTVVSTVESSLSLAVYSSVIATVYSEVDSAVRSVESLGLRSAIESRLNEIIRFSSKNNL
jgi:hypothetical protein